MGEAPPPLVALVGFKRQRLAPFGGVRVLLVRDGRVRILGKHGRADLDAPIAELSARTTKTKTVELRWPAGAAFVYGFSGMVKVPDEIEAIAARESEGAELIGPAPSHDLGFPTVKDVTGAAAAGRALVAALRERGAREGSR